MRLWLTAAVLLIASEARAEDLAAKVRDLETRLADTQRELQLLRKETTYFVYCERSDLYRDPRAPDDSGDLEHVLDRLVPLGVDPAFAQESIGRADPAPIAYHVRPGCSFLGGDRITEIDGIPVSDRARVRSRLVTQNEWRFTVAQRPSLSRKVQATPAPNGFDLATAMKLPGSEAKLVPTMIEGKERGFLVWSVAAGGILERAGLKVRDVVLEVNGRPLNHAGAQAFIANEWRTKGRLDVVLEREGQRFELTPIVGK